MQISNQKTTDELKEFEKLVISHHKLVLGFAISLVRDIHVAKDIAQDAFVSAFLKFDKFDSTRDFGKWIRGFVRIKFLEYNRQHRHISMEDELIDLLASQYGIWEQKGKRQKESIFITLEKCIEKLDEVAKSIIIKFYFEKTKCTEIARHCNLQEVTVRKRLERIRGDLKICMDNVRSRQ